MAAIDKSSLSLLVSSSSLRAATTITNRIDTTTTVNSNKINDKNTTSPYNNRRTMTSLTSSNFVTSGSFLSTSVEQSEQLNEFREAVQSFAAQYIAPRATEIGR